MSDMKHTALLFMAALLLASCTHNDRGAGTDAATYIPDAPDYADATIWYTRQNSTADKGADIFYLVSTWETVLPRLHLGDRLDYGGRARLPLCRRA